MTDMALFELIITCAGVILLAAGAAAGMILGRKAAFAGPLSGYGTPLALLLTLVLLLLWKDEAARRLWMIRKKLYVKYATFLIRKIRLKF